MSEIKIFDSEMHLMNKIWDEKSIKAIDLANWALENLGWKKSTTYSVLKKLQDKGAIHRQEPGFVLTALVSRDEVAQDQTNQLVEKMFGGSMKLFLTSLVQSRTLGESEVEELRQFIEDNEKEM